MNAHELVLPHAFVGKQPQVGVPLHAAGIVTHDGGGGVQGGGRQPAPAPNGQVVVKTHPAGQPPSLSTGWQNPAGAPQTGRAHTSFTSQRTPVPHGGRASSAAPAAASALASPPAPPSFVRPASAPPSPPPGARFPPPHVHVATAPVALHTHALARPPGKQTSPGDAQAPPITHVGSPGPAPPPAETCVPPASIGPACPPAAPAAPPFAGDAPHAAPSAAHSARPTIVLVRGATDPRDRDSMGPDEKRSTYRSRRMSVKAAIE
jgi:hypothetical protein